MPRRGIDFLPGPTCASHQNARETGDSRAWPTPPAPTWFTPPAKRTLNEMLNAGLMVFEVWHPYHRFPYDVPVSKLPDWASYLLLCSDTHSPNDPRRK